MNIVADTNIFLAVVLNEPEKDSIIQMTGASDIVAPEVLPYEMGNALSAMLKRRQVVESEAIAALDAASKIPVRLVKTDIQAALKLAIAHNIYAYDAYFLHCALTLSIPLMTLDRRMKAVAKTLDTELMEPEK